MFFATSEIFQMVIVISLTVFVRATADDSECFVKPHGVQHAWNLTEPLKIDILIPPKWGQNMEHNLNISIGKMSFLLNSNQKTMIVTPRYFISFSKERPKAGWTSIFVLYRNNSVQFEDANGIALRYPHVSYNLPSSELTQINITVKGMSALVDCKSNVRTFKVKPDHRDAQAVLGMPIPVTFFRNLTLIEFYGNTTTYEVQLMLRVRSFFICKNSTDPDLHELTITNTNNYAFCGLSPHNLYSLKLNLSILDQKYTERNDGVTVGIVRIYATQATTYVRTLSSLSEIHLRSDDAEAKRPENSLIIHYLPSLIAVSISLAVIILLVIGAIVYYILRQKAKRTQEQLSSSGSWTQQNFNSINSATNFSIRNEVYEQQPGTKSSKKFSISSEYSNPVDEEYDEPIYAEGRESIYESIYESAYAAPKDAGDK